MKLIKFFLTGVFFGIVLSKSQAVSWFRIYEMFKFESFHMYGIIGSAIATGIILFGLMKKYKTKTIQGNQIEFIPKKKGKYRNILGGIIFGLGWGLAGACPGPIFVLLGNGVLAILIVLLGSLVGTFLYHSLKKYLPH